MGISGKTKVCAVIGDPIEHSLSPTIHNAAFQHLNLDFVYVAFQVKKEELSKAVRGIRSLNIHGLNVTMPHKTAIMKYLDDVDATAKAIGSVNTILNADGKLIGFNTDGIGALNALKNNQVELRGKRLLLLGAGGAAKAIAYQLAHEIEELRILNRTEEKAKKLAKFLQGKFNKNIVGEVLSPTILKERLKEADILINATSVGMHPRPDQTLIEREWLKPSLTVMDIVYDPPETRLLRDAKAVGAKVVNGVEMLLYQGAASFEIWCCRPAPLNVMREAIAKNLGRRGTGNT
ncbi:MAG: shikimate dehydrogenase [Nitrososphaerota archaeon]|nr:shikimate dehydrogenase [Candidatus Bathyarchaeota archaeon]MDW8022291.1 shikimate dehydrogenase [Nitrososphaerota archaeon]